MCYLNLRYSPDGRVIASCSDDKSVRIFDERTGSAIHVFQDPKGFGHSLVMSLSSCLLCFQNAKLHFLQAFHPSGTCVGVGTSDKKVKVYDIRMQKLQQLYSAHEAAVTQVNIFFLLEIHFTNVIF